MVNKELFMALEMLEKEKGIPMDVLCEGIQKALVTAIKRDYNNRDIVFCELDPEKKTIRVFVRKNVVSEVIDPDEDLTVEQAQKYKPTAMVGDIIEIELETKEVSRIAADKGKHVIRQGIREAEHGRIREEFQAHNQEIVTAKVSRVDPETKDAIVEIGKTQEPLFRSEQIPNETLLPGMLIKVYIAGVADAKEGRRYRELQFPERIPALLRDCLNPKFPRFTTERLRLRRFPVRQAQERRLPFTLRTKMLTQSALAYIQEVLV